VDWQHGTHGVAEPVAQPTPDGTGVTAMTVRSRAQALLAMGTHVVPVEIVGVDPHTEPSTYRFVQTISRGRCQQQRVAVARAIAARPALVLADEPTANLDGENAEILMHMMRDLRDRHGMTFIFSTHDPRVVAHAVRVVNARRWLRRA
jgi:ABC-type ATPase involved in cell division